MSLTKKDISGTIYESLDLPKKDCIRIVESVFGIMKDELNNGNVVKISGFGKWTVRAKKKRKGRNPQNGEAIMIDARKVITFKPSAALRDKIQ